MRLFWTPEAIHDRNQIYDYIDADSPHSAVALDELIAEKSVHLADYPNMGRSGRINGTREWVIHRNYVLIYDLAGDQIRILRVLHIARQWPSSEK